jgi:hypothetical protein
MGGHESSLTGDILQKKEYNAFCCNGMRMSIMRDKLEKLGGWLGLNDNLRNGERRVKVQPWVGR